MTTTIDTLTDEQVEAAIAEVTSPLLVQLNLSANEKTRLQRLCLDSRLTEAEYIVELLREQLGKRVGAACIKAATDHQGPKITGPKGLVTRG